MASRPTGKGRKSKQRLKETYAKAREDAQAAGLIPTTPEGAVRPEAVDPSSQGEQRFPGLDRLAIREGDSRGWAVPEHVKRRVIEKNAEVVFEEEWVERTILIDGVETQVRVKREPDRKAIHSASQILLLADQRQHERDNPDQVGKGKNGKVEVNVNVDSSTKVAVVESLDRLVEKARRRLGTSGGVDNSAEQPSPEGNDKGDN